MTERKFKVGDSVKVVSPNAKKGFYGRPKSYEGLVTVVSGVTVGDDPYQCDVDEGQDYWYFGADELELFISQDRISPHYTTDSSGKDFLQRFFETKSPEAVHGAMTFLMGKYIDRLGKKDAPEKELAKIIDYATRYRDFLNK